MTHVNRFILLADKLGPQWNVIFNLPTEPLLIRFQSNPIQTLRDALTYLHVCKLMEEVLFSTALYIFPKK